MNVTELKFDTMLEETALAQKFITSLNVSDYSKPGAISAGPPQKVDGTDEVKKEDDTKEEKKLQDKFIYLSMKVEENTELFSQLEHIRRGVPLRYVIEYDIKLIVHHLLYCSRDLQDSKAAKFSVSSQLMSTKDIIMDEETPLAYLGYFPMFYPFTDEKPITIYATEHSAPVCCLFVKLCREVGLNVELSLEKPSPVSSVLKLKASVGCWGVVTEHADIDSAVDVLLEWNTNYPWRLTKILVQECKYEEFKKIVDWKCREFSTDTVDEEVKRKSSKFNVYKEKIILFDYTDANSITVEAYRTSKELLALINKGPSYLSLWSNDFSETNEICHADNNTSLIWVNSRINFDGVKTARVVYEAERNITGEINVKVVDNKSIQNWKSWKQLSLKDRRGKIFEACKSLDMYGKIFDYVNYVAFDSSWVENGIMCTYKSFPADMILLEHFKNEDTFAKEVISNLLQGTYVIVLTKTKLGDALIAAKAPLAHSSSFQSQSFRSSMFLSRTRAVLTNYGTIFAN